MERREESEREERLGLLVGRWPPLSASAASLLIMIRVRVNPEAKDYW